MKECLFLLLILNVEITWSANCIYASPSGSDASGNGSLDQPYKTIWTSITSASHTSFTTVCLLPGEYSGINNTNWIIDWSIIPSLTIEGVQQETTSEVIISGKSNAPLESITSEGSDVSFNGIVFKNIKLNLKAIDVALINCTFTGAHSMEQGESLLNASALEIAGRVLLQDTKFVNNSGFDAVVQSTTRKRGGISIQGCQFQGNMGCQQIITSDYYIGIFSSLFESNQLNSNDAPIQSNHMEIVGSTFILNNMTNAPSLIQSNYLNISDSSFSCNAIDGHTSATPFYQIDALNFQNISIDSKCPIHCSNGQYSSEVFQRCRSCIGNTYAPSPNASQCIACPINSIAHASYDCHACPPGSESSETSCVECPIGFISSPAGCTACPEGTTTSQSGSTSCVSSFPKGAIIAIVIVVVVVVIAGASIGVYFYWRRKNLPKRQKYFREEDL
eukprot:TRINITY_DN9986_c0_g1_i1.p1 TRINITY_DN9986_c0_g1~~TRINITY_DN9986_c0_g1_i1.p1  ORF type:complete len:447 (-),score=82.27 TRINITY_DN9986_c0_g1_i1:53-1393(-)